MQEIFEYTDETQSVFSRLFSFGVRSMRNRECGMYEASDLLLGEHLYEKSDAVKWIAVDEPNKRKRVLKNFAHIKALHELDPDTEDIFDNSLIENIYQVRLKIIH